MGLYFNLAWRNIWRNKKRSIISISSVLFAVVIALVTRSMQLGSYEKMIDNSVSFYTGYIQIHAKGYWDKRSFDQTFILTDSLLEVVDRTANVTLSAPRLESFALASADRVSGGTMLLGIDPEREDRLTSLKHRLAEGEYLTPNDDGILLAKGLANHLKVGVGDTIVFISQGYQGMTAAGKYAVKGLINFPNPELNNRMSYLALSTAQHLFSADGRVTSLAVMITKPKLLDQVYSDLKGKFDQRYEVMSWEEMLPEMVSYIEFDNAQGMVTLVIIYMVVGFGILGTVLMMTLERTREFGMLLAVGMSRARLRMVITLESILLSVTGALAGALLGFPVLLYYSHNPIQLTGEYETAMLSYGLEPVMPFLLEPGLFVAQTLAVLVIALIVAVYPVWRVGKLEPCIALRNG